MKYRKPTKADRKRTIIYLTGYIVAISAGAFLLLTRGVIGVMAWVLIVAGGLYLLGKVAGKKNRLPLYRVWSRI